MPSYGDAFYETFVANADLGSYQYYCVACGSVVGEVKRATGASGPGIIGILQNNPYAGDLANVCIFGVTKAKVSAKVLADTSLAVATNDFLTCGSTGWLQPRPTGACSASTICNALALEAVASGESGIIEVLLLPGIGAHTAADNLGGT